MRIPSIRALTALLAGIVALTACGRDSSWALPISLGQPFEEVRTVLGAPTAVIKGGMAIPERPGQTAEWYYSAGLAATFQDGRLSEVLLNPHITYRGFLPYHGEIVNGLTLRDTREEFLKRLGPATKVEQVEEIGNLLTGEKAALGEPSVWPAKEVLYWRRPQYVVEAAFLMQPQDVNEQGLVFPKGAIDYVKVYK